LAGAFAGTTLEAAALVAAALVAAALVAATFAAALAGALVAGPLAGAWVAVDLLADALMVDFVPEGLAVAFLAAVLAAGIFSEVVFFAGTASVPEVALAAVLFFGAAFDDVAVFLAGAALVVPAGDFFTAVNSTSLRDLPVVPRTAPGHCGTDVPPTSTSG
jgi:hypothetical protein